MLCLACRPERWLALHWTLDQVKANESFLPRASAEFAGIVTSRHSRQTFLLLAPPVSLEQKHNCCHAARAPRAGFFLEKKAFWLGSLRGFLCASALVLTGCRHFSPASSGEYVYVMAKQTFLRDRVAAVSNKVATVNNGEKLEVVDHGRRFLKVKTSSGAVGWLEEHMIIDQPTYDKFKALHDAHLHDKPVVTAVLRDDLYAHLLPGRDTPRFLLLPENDKLELIQRASIPKEDTQNAWMRPAAKGAKLGTAANPAVKVIQKPAAPVPAHPAKGKKGKHGKVDEFLAQFMDPNAPPMEDWWLVRDAQGRVGWVLARRLDVDVPDEVVQYSEGQRIIGAFLLNKVSDPDSKFPNGEAPNYLAVLSPYKDGLPFDFNQIRVYAWNVKKHRYEGAYRKRDIAGYLPVTVKHQVEELSGPYAAQPVPVFTVKVAVDGAMPSLDPATGLVKQVETEDQTFSLEGETVKRLQSDAPVVAGQPPAPKPAPVITPGSNPPAQKAKSRRHHRVVERKKKKHHLG